MIKFLDYACRDISSNCSRRLAYFSDMQKVKLYFRDHLLGKLGWQFGR